MTLINLLPAIMLGMSVCQSQNLVAEPSSKSGYNKIYYRT